jgi:hypothetical protein
MAMTWPLPTDALGNHPWEPITAPQLKNFLIRPYATALGFVADAEHQGAAMIKQLAMDVEAAESDKFRIGYCNDFELPRGGDTVQPAVDLILLG